MLRLALERLAYNGKAHRVTYRSDKVDGPTAGSETLAPLEFLARLATDIPDKGQVMTRYYGWYANRPRGKRKQRPGDEADGGPVVRVAEQEGLRLRAARLRWAELLRRIFEVDPLRRPRRAGAMRIVAFLSELTEGRIHEGFDQ